MKRILCYGDSNTYGANPEWTPGATDVPIRQPADVRWPKVLQSLLGTEDYEIIEEGLSGRTTVYRDHAWPYCNGRDYLTPCILSHYPFDLLVIMLGSNDLKAVFAPCADSCSLAMEELLKVACNPFLYNGGKVPEILLVSPIRIGENIKESFMYGTFTETSRMVSEQLPACYKILADRYGCAFFDAGSVAEASPIDCVHMNADNHKKLAYALKEQIEAIFLSDNK